jgi:transposase
MNERVTMNKKDIQRLYVIQQVDEKKLSGAEAGKHLGLSIRQIWRLVARYREKGAPGCCMGTGTGQHINRTEKRCELKSRGWRRRNIGITTTATSREELAEEHGLWYHARRYGG